MRTLEERINGPDSEPWIPEDEGDFVIGELEEVSTREGDYGPYKVLHLWTSDGRSVTVAGFGQVLASKFETVTDADLGNKVAIVFQGEKRGKSGREYKAYDFKVERKVAAVAGGDFEGDDDI